MLVSLVQTAASLPIVVLALPAGAWADLVDRRRLLLGAQSGMFLSAAALAGLTFAGADSPAVILALTFLLGCGNAVAGPAWQAIQPDLVDRALLPQAAALNGVNMNLARAVGPALGGIIVATAGAGWVFALNAVSFVGIAAVVARWRAPERVDGGSRERFVEALRAGGRYVRNALIVRRLLYRAILFIPAASAVWALLPVVAARNLGLGSGGYGLLLGMVGVGAVAGAFVIPRLRASGGLGPPGHRAPCWSRPRPSPWSPRSAARSRSASPSCRSAAAWIAVMSSLNSGLQLALPNWVRARGLASYLVVFQGAQAVGAVVWGAVADRTSATTSLLGPPRVLAVAAVVGLRTPMPDTSTLDRTPSAHWPAPQLTLSPNADDGPVLVTLTYRVPEDNAVAFTSAMRHVGRSRRRTGALRWELFRDGTDPTRFVESYLVGHLGGASTTAREPADRCRSQVRGRGPPLRPRRTGGGAPLPTPRSSTARALTARLPRGSRRRAPELASSSSPGPPTSASTPRTAAHSASSVPSCSSNRSSWVISACTCARRAARSSQERLDLLVPTSWPASSAVWGIDGVRRAAPGPRSRCHRRPAGHDRGSAAVPELTRRGRPGSARPGASRRLGHVSAHIMPSSSIRHSVVVLVRLRREAPRDRRSAAQGRQRDLLGRGPGAERADPQPVRGVRLGRVAEDAEQRRAGRHVVLGRDVLGQDAGRRT